MSPLPQRKKSAEELSQLRDQLGVFPQPQVAPFAAPQTTPVNSPQAAPATLPPPATTYPPKTAKPVRSLRRSEREPAHSRRASQPSQPSPFSRIPASRHSTNELDEMRRREAISQFNPNGTTTLFPLPAPRWVILPGYLLALSGFLCQYWTYEIPLTTTAGMAGFALLVALYILIRRPLSRHHAGFISIITLLALVFAALHYFPQLRHAS